ncbi:MAG: WecB/TagA/CpsF family glycosyltransferase [Clostridiales bacterium]|nr:WecB/TagA/CpsF family glycosyltransferase [Clostridiales bacterium]
MKVNILGTLIDNISKEKALKILFSFINSANTQTIYTPNAEICMEAYKNKTFQQVLNEGSLVIPDGQGVVLASKILKTPIDEKVAGFKLILSLLESNKPISIYLFGSNSDTVERAVSSIKKNYSNITIAGYRNGYFKDEEIPLIISDINKTKAELLLVGLGAPKQELFIHQYKDKIKCNVIMGVGGSIDVLAGKVKKVPEIFVNLSLEWFYRLLKQPKRLLRMLKIPLFLYICIKKRIFGKS